MLFLSKFVFDLCIVLLLQIKKWTKTNLDFTEDKTQWQCGSGISWTICKSALYFVLDKSPQQYPATQPFQQAQPTVSKHWRNKLQNWNQIKSHMQCFQKSTRRGDTGTSGGDNYRLSLSMRSLLFSSRPAECCFLRQLQGALHGSKLPHDSGECLLDQLIAKLCRQSYTLYITLMWQVCTVYNTKSKCRQE